MAFLLDTNVLSELRKKRRYEPKVQSWFGSVDSEDLFTSVIIVGEIRQESKRFGRPTQSLPPNSLWLRRLQIDYPRQDTFDYRGDR
jgi:predicted nucleic acid-binding protein